MHRLQLPQRRPAFITLILCLWFPLASATAGDDTANPSTSLAPIPFEAQYDVSMNGSNQLDGTRRLRKTGDNEFTLVYKAEHFLFDIKETSTFDWINGKLIPRYYRSERSHLFGSNHKDVRFDWGDNIAKFYYKDKKGSFDLEPEAVDPLSTMFVLSMQIQQGITETVIRETEDNDIDDRRYTIDGPEVLSTSLGNVNTIKATLHDKETASIWFAVDYNYLAVKVRHESKDGDIYEMSLTDYKGPMIERGLPTPNTPVSAPVE